MQAGHGAYVDQVIGGHHNVAVVLHHQDAVAYVPQIFEGNDEALVVPLVQPDGGLVQDIGDALELGPDLRGQADPLGFSPAQGSRGAFQGQVGQPHVEQELEALADLLQDILGNGVLLVVEALFQPVKPGPKRIQVPGTELRYILLRDPEPKTFLSQAGAFTGVTGL